MGEKIALGHGDDVGLAVLGLGVEGEKRLEIGELGKLGKDRVLEDTGERKG